MIDFKVLPEALLFIAGAVPNTLFMAFVSIFFGILFGSFIAVLRLGNNMFINIFFTVFVSFFRAVPGIVQLFIVYYSLPYLLAPVFSAFTGTEVKPFDVSPYWSVYLCFILYNTAYQSENIRGALRSVDHGQYEAAVAMGMTSHKNRPSPGVRRGASRLLHILSENHQTPRPCLHSQSRRHVRQSGYLLRPLQSAHGTVHRGRHRLLGTGHTPHLPLRPVGKETPRQRLQQIWLMKRIEPFPGGSFLFFLLFGLKPASATNSIFLSE